MLLSIERQRRRRQKKRKDSAFLIVLKYWRERSIKASWIGSETIFGVSVLGLDWPSFILRKRKMRMNNWILIDENDTSRKRKLNSSALPKKIFLFFSQRHLIWFHSSDTFSLTHAARRRCILSNSFQFQLEIFSLISSSSSSSSTDELNARNAVLICWLTDWWKS